MLLGKTGLSVPIHKIVDRIEQEFMRLHGLTYFIKEYLSQPGQCTNLLFLIWIEKVLYLWYQLLTKCSFGDSCNGSLLSL